MEFKNGVRVRHLDDGSTGTVHLFTDAGPQDAQGEVQWDDSVCASELALVADRLELIR